MDKKIAIFGHRKIEEEDKRDCYLENKVKNLFVNLVEKGDNIYLFGSNSEFNDLSYTIMTQLQKRYTNINRIGYLCASEVGFTLDEAARYEKYIKNTK